MRHLLTVLALMSAPPAGGAQCPDSPQTTRVVRLMARGDWNAAYAAARDVVAERPRDALAHALLGDAAATRGANRNLIFLFGAVREARRAYDRAIGLDSLCVRAWESRLGYLLEAPGLFGGDRERAGDVAERIFQMDSVRGALAELRVARARDMDADSLRHRVRALVAQYPDDSLVLIAAGRFFENATDAAEAVAIYERLWMMDTTRATTAYRLGLAHHWAGSTTQAGSWYARAFAMEHASPDAARWLGVAAPAWALARLAIRRDDVAEALRWTDSVLVANPRHERALRARDSLHVVRRSP